MKLDDYSFELHQERVDKCHTQCLCHPPFHLSIHSGTTDKYFTFKYDDCLACLSYPSVTYPHVPDEAWMNNHQASYLVSIHLIFVLNDQISLSAEC